MQSEKRIIVLKFGSSVLRSESDLPTAVHEIYRWWREGFQVVAVVSAFGNTTDELTRARTQYAINQTMNWSRRCWPRAKPLHPRYWVWR